MRKDYRSRENRCCEITSKGRLGRARNGSEGTLTSSRFRIVHDDGRKLRSISAFNDQDLKTLFGAAALARYSSK